MAQIKRPNAFNANQPSSLLSPSECEEKNGENEEELDNLQLICVHFDSQKSQLGSVVMDVSPQSMEYLGTYLLQ